MFAFSEAGQQGGAFDVYHKGGMFIFGDAELLGGKIGKHSGLLFLAEMSNSTGEKH